MLKLESMYPVIMDLEALNGGQGPRWDDPRRNTFRKLDNLKYMLESEVKNMEQYRVDIAATGWSSSYGQLLSPDTTSFFVFHKSGTEKDAKVMISRVEMKNFQDIREIWNTEIPGLFFDPSDASETNPFKEVFSKGDPEFGFSQFDMAGNRLIVIWMLHVHCLDMETGTILWKFRV